VHQLVIQQIAQAKDAAGRIDIDRFAKLVSDAYDELDRERRRTNRSMSLMVDKIDEVNRGLDRFMTERTQQLKAREALLHTQNLRFEAALSNMTQGLLLYDSAARLVICNQRYIEMYGLSPNVVKPGCSLRDLIAHRKETGSFKGDVD
jgi:PAS domain-containing protein